MTTVQVHLPDELARRAQGSGLLTDAAIQALLEGALRKAAGQRLLETAQRLQAENIPPMQDDEVVAEVNAVRAARRVSDRKN